MKSTNYVRGAPEAKILQRGGCKARGITFGAKQDDLYVMIVCGRQSRTGGWGKTPLEHVPLNDQGAEDTTFGCTPILRSNVDMHRFRLGNRIVGFIRREPSQSDTCS